MRKFREALFLCLCALCTVDSQPVTCTTEAQCSEGYFCETSVHICRECLRCEDLNREPSSTPSTCITSVADCGACFKGLVLDRLADVNGACVVSGAEESSGTPHYVWWLGSAVIIFLALMIGIIVYISMNPGIFENFKCGGNCQSGTVSANIRTETKPSAPEAPPPYTPRPQNGNQYSSVRTAESPCPTTQHNEQGDNNAEEEVSFIKHSPATPPPDPRETAGKQGARVYNLPSYAREELPHSPETPMVTEVHDNLDIHDEETMESTWSPTNVSEATTGVTGAAGSSVPAVTAARDDSFCELTPASQMCLQTNSNYSNRENNPSGDTSQGTFSGSQNSALYNYVNINVFQNANVHCQNKYS